MPPVLPPMPISDVTHVIQLSIAPVFLLTSIAAVLGVLSTRLGRVVDRYRAIEDRLPAIPDTARRAPLEAEAMLLYRRRKLVHVAMTLGTSAALLVCFLIATAFVGALTRTDVSVFVAAQVGTSGNLTRRCFQ